MCKTWAVLLIAGAIVSAAPVTPQYYNLLNGSTGTWTYWDDTYTCQGIAACTPLANRTTDGASLTGGLGDLTDGVIPAINWNTAAGVGYVGWTIDPVITFTFAPGTTIQNVTISMDDSNGAGGVSTPTGFLIGNGTTSTLFSVTDPAGSLPFSRTFNISALNLTTTVAIQALRQSTWVMLSEVSFDGTGSSATPEPGSLMLAAGGLAVLAWRKLR